MKNGLTRARTVINDEPVSFCVQSFIFSDLFRCPEEMPDEILIVFRHAVNFR